MNIIEAIKSGKRVRRKGWEDWWRPNDLVSKHGLLVGDIRASDWEVEEALVTINREQLFAAYHKALHKVIHNDAYIRTELLDTFAKELGL